MELTGRGNAMFINIGAGCTSSAFFVSSLFRSFDSPSVHSFVHPFIYYSFVHLSIHSFFHPSIHSSVYPSTYLFIHPFIHPFVRSSIQSSIHPFVHSFIHSSSTHALFWSRSWWCNLFRFGKYKVWQVNTKNNVSRIGQEFHQDWSGFLWEWKGLGSIPYWTGWDQLEFLQEDVRWVQILYEFQNSHGNSGDRQNSCGCRKDLIECLWEQVKLARIPMKLV